MHSHGAKVESSTQFTFWNLNNPKNFEVSTSGQKTGEENDLRCCDRDE